MTTNGNEERPLPDGWTITTLGEIATLVGGGTPSRKIDEYFGGEIVWLTPTEIPKNGVTLISESREKITKLGLRKSSAKIVPPGTVLLTSRASIGYVGIAGTEVTTNQGFASFICEEGIHNFYLGYWFRANVDLLEREATGTTFKEISKRKLRELDFPLAPFEEQTRIVAEIEKQFTRLDQAVASLHRLQDKLARYKASVLKAACEGQLVSQDENDEPASDLLARILAERRAQWEVQEWQKLVEKAQKKAAQANRKAAGRPSRISDLETAEWQAIPEDAYAGYLPKGDKWKRKYKEPEGVETAELPELPEGWVWSTVGQVSECLDSMRIPVNKKERAKRQGEIPYYGANGQVGWIDDYIFDEPLVLVVEDETFTGRQIPFTYKITGKSWVNNHAHVLRSLATTTDYLNYSLMFYPFTPLTTGTTGRRKLTQRRLLPAPYALPPLAEQKRIVAEVERRLSVIAATEQAIAANLSRAHRLRQSILHRAFTGRLV